MKKATATKTKKTTDAELAEQLGNTWDAMKALTGKNPQIFRLTDGWGVDVRGCTLVHVGGANTSQALVASGPTITDAVLNAWANITNLEEGQHLMVQRRALVWAGGMVGFVPAPTPPKAKKELGSEIPLDEPGDEVAPDDECAPGDLGYDYDGEADFVEGGDQ